jgi:rhodanese-related sulfurtransferase
MDAAIRFSDLQSSIRGTDAPLVIDVRRTPAFKASTEMIAGALRRDPDEVASWARELPRAAETVVYCVHGHEVSQGVAQALNERGFTARYLEGGIEEGWKAAGGTLDRKPAGAMTRWVTRERPKIDRMACPWLVSRFVDRDAEFLYVPAATALQAAKERDAVPYDVPNVAFSHQGELCSFDAFIKHFRLRDPALDRLAVIVRGADTARPDLAPQAEGLLAISRGLSLVYSDDHEMLRHGMVMYDALYAWCKEGQDETHTWIPTPGL